MIKGGSVMRLPMENPNTAQAMKSNAVSLVQAMTQNAAAWAAIDTAAVVRGSRRSTTTPRQSRPVNDIAVVSATARPASGRLIAGSSNAIWCTMKPTCASNASANGAVMVQNARFPSSLPRDSVGAMGSFPADRPGADNPTNPPTAGTSTTSITTVMVSMALVKPILSTRKTKAGATM